jgi:threonylcarbamoyladenosine tRNA methylthiotransferase MtaB
LGVELNSASDKLKFLLTKTDRATSSPARVGLTTLGCKVNQFETAALEEDLKKNYFSLVPFNSFADIYIINTCTVTASSDYQARQQINRAHRINPQARIIVTGCYAQIASSTLAQIDGVSLVVGNDQKNNIARLLIENITPASRILVDDIFRQEKFCVMPVTGFRGRTRAFLKIQDGCDSFCSYCIVPFARGKSRSMPPQKILTALAGLDREHYKEIVLTGIHLGAYGHDLQPATNLFQLLHLVFSKQWNMRFRLSSIEPREITDDLLSIFHSNDLLCPHLHIPLQSGDDTILQLMRRNYDTHFYRNLIEKICSTVSDIAIGIDVMTGFPSESDKQFENTLNFLEELPVAYLHVFPFSDRPGTPAQKLQLKISSVVKKERAAILRDLSTRKREKFALRFLGKPLKILVEKTKDKKTGLQKGFSQNYLPFLINGDISFAANEIVTVKATKYSEGKLYGKIVS